MTIANFKAIGEPVRIEFAPITLLLGANSSGKSSIINAIHYAAEVFDRRNLDADKLPRAGKWIGLGGFQQFVHKHEAQRTVTLRFEMDLSQGMELPSSPFLTESACGIASLKIRSAEVGIDVCFPKKDDYPLVDRYVISLNGRRVAAITASEPKIGTAISDVDLGHPLFSPDVLPGQDVGWLKGLKAVLQRRDKKIALHSQDDAMPSFDDILKIQNDVWGGLDPVAIHKATWFLTKLLVAPGRLLRDQVFHPFRYIGPIREIPFRQYEPARSPESARWSSGLAAWDELYTCDPLRLAQISDWLSDKKRLDTGYKLRRKKGKGAVPPQVALIDKKSKVPVAPQDVGVGISQLVPVVVGSLIGRPILTVIEQPELHLHPRAQVRLGDLFASAAKLGGSTNVLIAETHSEHLLLRLMRRMRETHEDNLPKGAPSLQPQDVSILFVEPDDSGIRVRQMPLNERGELVKRWPGGFFEEGLREVFPDNAD